MKAKKRNRRDVAHDEDAVAVEVPVPPVPAGKSVILTLFLLISLY